MAQVDPTVNLILLGGGSQGAYIRQILMKGGVMERVHFGGQVGGARAPKLVTVEMVKAMEPGSVLVDVAIDQGGCIETIDHITTHSEPTFVKHGVIHYAVANMPGAVARTSTIALTNVTIVYALEIADKGWQAAVRSRPGLARGVNVTQGKVTYKAVAEAIGLPYTPLEELLSAA